MRVALLVDPLAVRLREGEHPRELAVALAARGHAVRTFGAPTPAEGFTGATEEAGQNAGRAGRNAGREAGREAGQEAGREPAKDERDGRHILAFAPDALIAYEALSPAAWLACRIARRRAAPLVLVEGGPLPGARWVERALLRAGQSLWGGFVRHTPHALVAVDPLARERALAQGFDARRITLLPHGVDLQRFRPGLPSPLLARHRIGGRILLRPSGCDAGAEMLIAAFAQTVGRRGDWALVLTGASRPARLRAAADRAGIGASVHLLQAADTELPALYSSSTLVALPELADSPGQALQRALACGKPVLASDWPGARFVLERASAGLLVPPADVEAWTGALRQAAASPEARSRWSAAALQAARRTFSWAAIAEGFEHAIQAAGAPTGPRAGPEPAQSAGPRARRA